MKKFLLTTLFIGLGTCLLWSIILISNGEIRFIWLPIVLMIFLTIGVIDILEE